MRRRRGLEEGWGRRADAETMVTNGGGVQTLTNAGDGEEIDQTVGLTEGCNPPEESVRGCKVSGVDAERMSMQPDCTGGNTDYPITVRTRTGWGAMQVLQKK